MTSQFCLNILLRVPNCQYEEQELCYEWETKKNNYDYKLQTYNVTVGSKM